MTRASLRPEQWPWLLLLFILVPFTLIGGIAGVSLSRRLSAEAVARRETAARQVAAQIGYQSAVWRRTVHFAGDAIRLAGGNAEQERAALNSLVVETPDLMAIALRNPKGDVRARADRVGSAVTFSTDLPAVPASVGTWTGSVRFPTGDFPLIPIFAGTRGGLGTLEAVFRLDGLEQFLGALGGDVGIFDGGRMIAHTAPGRVLRGSLISGARGIETRVFDPASGWEIRVREPRSAVYGALLLPGIYFAAALGLVAGLTFLIAVVVARRARAAIVHNERLSTMGLMAGVVGHEIRTALAVLRNSLQFLEQRLGESDPITLRHLDIMREQVRASDHILTDILSFTRRRETRPESLDLNAAVYEFVGAFAVPALIRVQWSLATNIPRIEIDRSDFKQTIGNVLTNAIQAMPTGGDLTLETRGGPDGVSLFLRDSGSGIDAQVREKIFEPFFTTKSQGTGLGLTVVKMMMERYGGSVLLQNGADGGAVVELRFRSAKFVPVATRFFPQAVRS